MKGAIYQMSKNQKIICVFIAFIICSVLSGYFIFQYLSPQRTTIYVFNNDYEAGTQITEGMLTPMQVDSNIVLNGLKSDVSLRFVTNANYQEIIYSGDSLRMDVGEGSPLMESMLSISGGSSVEMNMKTTAVGVTIGVNNITGITNELKSGSRVNIYMSIDGMTTLILENMRVLNVAHNNGTIVSVTIECDIEESLLLINANTYGTLHLGIVDNTGYQYSEEKNPTFTLYSNVN